MSQEGPTHAPVRTPPKRLLTALALGCCVALAFGVRAWALWRRGVIDFDETYCYMLGRNLVTGRGYTLNGLPHTAFPPLYPIIVGLSGLFTESVRLATSAISAIAGALLPIPVYFLAGDIHGRRAGLLAAASAAVWPGLFFFAAVNVPYAQRMYVGSEPLYVTIVAAAMLFLWRSARYGGYANALVAGALAGLASLVRSEGPVLFFFLLLWLLADALATGAIRRRRKWLETAALAAAMLAVLAPFLVYVRGVTGTWTLGARIASSARIRDALRDRVRVGDSRQFMLAHYRLNDDNTVLEDPFWGVSEWHKRQAFRQNDLKEGFALVADPDWRWLRVFADLFWTGWRPLVPRYAWVLVLVGLVLPPWGAVRLRWWLFVSFNFLAMAVLAVSLYALARHELPLVSLFAVGLGKGFSAVTDLFGRAARHVMHMKRFGIGMASLVPAFVVFLVMCDSGVRTNNFGNRRPGVDRILGMQAQELRLGQFLGDGLRPGATLMCSHPWIALYGGMDWRASPLAAPERLLSYVRNNRIDYAVLYPWELGLDPRARALFEPYLVGWGYFDLGEALYDFEKQAPGEPPDVRAPQDPGPHDRGGDG